MVWQNDIVANHSLAKWYFDNMIFWQSNTLATWHFGNMISWDTHWPLSKQSHCSKQTILQTISRNSRKLNGRRTTNPKVFDLHRKNSSKNIMEETDPQEPELCATKSDFDLLIRLHRIVRCAKGGTRLGCVLSSRVPGRRDAGTPPCMNMLWSHALPIRVFHVKTVQPSLNLRFFGHENHVSWSFYRFMWRDKRHCSQVLWFGAGSTNSNQAQIPIVAQTHSTNQKKHIGGIYLIEHFHFT